jgi:hypothetical protein
MLQEVHQDIPTTVPNHQIDVKRKIPTRRMARNARAVRPAGNILIFGQFFFRAIRM